MRRRSTSVIQGRERLPGPRSVTTHGCRPRAARRHVKTDPPNGLEPKCRLVSILACRLTELSRPAEADEDACNSRDGRGVPSAWTMIHFEFPEDQTESVANALADVLDSPGWYTNFDTPDDTIVIFPGRVFRYPRGEEAARAEAEAYAATLGIPAPQLDW